MGPVFQFGNYKMSVLKHYEGINARSFELDREAWIMLLAFLEDLRTTQIVAKSMSTFGIMVHWHADPSLAHVVVQVYLNDDRKILDSVKINAGVPIKGKSWIVPCYVIKRKTVQELQDEEPYVTSRPLHPIPTPAPHWMGPVPPAASSANPENSNAGGSNNMIVDVQGRVHGVQVDPPTNAVVVDPVDPVSPVTPSAAMDGNV